MSNNISVETQIISLNKADTKKFFKFQKWVKKSWQLTAMIFLPFCFIILFHYVPMYGIQIAFKDYKAADGIWGSKWVGFKHFVKFFNSYLFVRVVRNTILLNIYSLIAGFPIPIILALSLNSCRNLKFKKTVQMVTYAPHFISVVVLIGMVIQVLSPKYGIVNNVIKALGGEEILFMAEGKYFRSIYVWSGIWQNMGFSAIIYISAMNDPTIFEFETIPPLKGPTGLKQSPLEFWQPSPFFFISSYCEHPEVAIRWADAQFYDCIPDLKSGNLEWLNWWYGQEDVGWARAQAGEVGFTGKPAIYKWLFNWGENQNTHLYENFLINMKAEWKELIAIEMGSGYNQEKILYDSTVKNYIPYEVDKTLPSLSLPEEDAIEIAELETNLTTYYQEMMAKFIRGEADLDRDWDVYLKELDNIGLKRYLEILQEAYDRTMK